MTCGQQRPCPFAALRLSCWPSRWASVDCVATVRVFVRARQARARARSSRRCGSRTSRVHLAANMNLEKQATILNGALTRAVTRDGTPRATRARAHTRSDSGHLNGSGEPGLGARCRARPVQVPILRQPAQRGRKIYRPRHGARRRTPAHSAQGSVRARGTGEQEEGRTHSSREITIGLGGSTSLRPESAGGGGNTGTWP
jgi:hypothetical protein